MTNEGFEVDLMVHNLNSESKVPFQNLGRCHFELSEYKNKEKILSFKGNFFQRSFNVKFT